VADVLWTATDVALGQRLPVDSDGASGQADLVPPSPAAGSPFQAPEGAAAAETATAAGEPGTNSDAAGIAAPSVTEEEATAAPTEDTATVVSPCIKPQKPARCCNFCAFHGQVSVASPTHTKDCYFANQCFCFRCAKRSARNRGHKAARKKRLAAVAANTAEVAS